MKLAHFQNRLDRGVRESVFPGYSFAYIEEGDVQFCSGGRYTYDDSSPAVQTDTLYDVASLTKIVGPMTLAMLLVDDGVLQLDTKISDYLPSFKNDDYKKEATVLHALTYTLDYNIPGGSKSLMGSLSSEDIAKNTLNYPFKYAPGSNYMYSNLTAFVLTQIIEKVTGENFNNLVTKRIFLPLGMKHSTFSPTTEQVGNIPPTEITKDRGLVQGLVHDEFSHGLTKGGVSSGAAGLFSSVVDLVPFLQMATDGGVYKGHQFISTEIVEKWITNQLPALLPTPTPLGWGDLNNEFLGETSHKIIIKGGFTGCLMVGDLTAKRGFIWLSNRTYPKRPEDKNPLQQLKRDLIDILLSE